MTTSQSNNLADLRPVEIYDYATYVPGRSGGDYKRHRTLALARSSVNGWSRKRGADKLILQWDSPNRTWIEIERIPNV